MATGESSSVVSVGGNENDHSNLTGSAREWRLCVRHLGQLLNSVEVKMSDARNYDSVVILREDLEAQWGRIVDIHTVCMQSIEVEEERQTIDEAFNSYMMDVKETIVRINNWVCDIDNKDDDKNSKISCDSASRRRAAELKLQQLQKRQELEDNRREIEKRIERLKLEEEIESTRLEEEMFDDAFVQQLLEEHFKTENRLNRSAHSGIMESSSQVPALQQAQDLQFVVKTLQDSLNLPKPELLSFSGHPGDYCKFMCNFETIIEGRVTDPRLRLSYLIQYCTGEAKRSIDDCVVLPPEDGYQRAKKILLTRYGKPHLVARSHIERIVNGPPIKANDTKALMELSLDMEKCDITISQIGFESDINNSENLRKIVKRLPMHLRSKWTESACKIIETGYEPKYKDLLKFVQGRANVANTMYGQDLASDNKNVIYRMKPGKKGDMREKAVTLVTRSDKVSEIREYGRRVLACVYCKGEHKLIECPKFKGLDLVSRRSVVQKHRMCFNCLNFKHVAKFCRKPRAYTVQGCNQKHHTLLHEGDEKVTHTGSVGATIIQSTKGKICLRIVPVVVYNGRTQIHTYALLDAGSDVTLCSERLVKRLGIKSVTREFTITTVNQTNERRTGHEVNVEVSSIDRTGKLRLNRVWSVDRLPISLDSIADQSEIKQWNHLAGINIPKIGASEIELLIGSDTPEAFWVEDQRRGGYGEPYAIKSLLGWTVMGPTGGRKQSRSRKVNVNFQKACIEEQIESLWKTDFQDQVHDGKTGMSQEDCQAMRIMVRSLTIEDGHYKMGLPWRDIESSLPNNRTIAVARLRYLKNKLQKMMSFTISIKIR